MINLARMLAGYTEAIEFTDMANGDECHGHEFAAETSAAFAADCAKFIEALSVIHSKDGPAERSLLDCVADFAADYSDEQMGRDFWLTRNGHGAGFWDRDELSPVVHGSTISLGDALSTVAERFGNCDLYVGDDGEIYA